MESPADMDAADSPVTNANGDVALANALALLQDAKNDIARLRLAIVS